MKVWNGLAALAVVLAPACTGLTGEEPNDELAGETGTAPDADGDGLSDADEDALGTDPTASDSDGDGFSDGEEVDQNTDPTDQASVPFEGGWPISACNGKVEGEGWDEGDVSNDWAMTDQFGESVNLHAFCDNVVYLVFAAFW